MNGLATGNDFHVPKVDENPELEIILEEGIGSAIRVRQLIIFKMRRWDINKCSGQGDEDEVLYKQSKLYGQLADGRQDGDYDKWLTYLYSLLTDPGHLLIKGINSD